MTVAKSASALVAAAAAFVILWIAIPMAGELFDSSRASWETSGVKVGAEPSSPQLRAKPTTTGGTEAVAPPSGQNIRTGPTPKQHGASGKRPGVGPAVTVGGVERLGRPQQAAP